MEARHQRGAHWEKRHMQKVTCLNLLAGTVQSILRVWWPQDVVDERRNQQEDALIAIMCYSISCVLYGQSLTLVRDLLDFSRRLVVSPEGPKALGASGALETH
jgi:hypothetical protein